jgi:hypothetical protein
VVFALVCGWLYLRGPRPRPVAQQS